jgi:hypothetical protein
MKNIIKNLVKELKNEEELRGIGKRFVFLIKDNKDSCRVIIGNYETLRNNLNLKSITEAEKKIEEKKIIKKELTNLDFMLLSNKESKFSVICLEERDLQNTKVKYLIIDNENKEEIKGRIVVPLIYSKENNEMIIFLSEKIIKRNDILGEFKITPDNKLLGISEKEFYITLR